MGRTKKLMAVVAMAGSVMLGLGAGSSSAATYPTGQMQLTDEGSVLKADAVFGGDCSGTVGCWKYIKIERSRWWGWEYVGGSWVYNNGWNSLRIAQPGGCFNYRIVAEAYNDAFAPIGGSVTVGPVGVGSNGQKITRYKTTWNSGASWHC